MSGRPLVIGRRIRVNEQEAAVIRRVFEWAADGVGSATIVDRLNREGVPGTRGGRWTKTPVQWILKNERYLGRHIWGQRGVERDPTTGRKIQRYRRRSEWKIVERPEMRIISDELWERAQATRKEIRQAVASKESLARGKSGKYHSQHLFSGFAKCGTCGGAISSVSGGKGSPRWGCSRSWQNGTSACTNRLTIRIKVAEPQILAKLQEELLQPKNVAYIAKAVERGGEEDAGGESEFHRHAQNARSGKPEAAKPFDSTRRRSNCSCLRPKGDRRAGENDRAARRAAAGRCRPAEEDRRG